MGIVSRGVRNAFRNVIRTGSIVFILAISISMALVMLLALKTVQSKIDSVKSSVGNTITVSPAGVQGFSGGGELLTDADIQAVGTLPHVSKVTETLSDRLTTGQDTTLVTAIDAGSFGNRQRDRSGAGPQGESGGARGGQQRTFTMPIMVTGVNDLTNTQALNINELKITSGTTFDASKDENNAIVGTELATKNSLKVGSTLNAYSTDIKVVGIYDSGNRFTNTSFIMPMKALQRLSNQPGSVSTAIAQVDSIDNLATAKTEITGKLGSKADVVSSQESTDKVIQPLENIKTISFYSLVGSLVAGSVIIFLTMLMIVRERRKEIGVLKAIGASNIKITLQFVSEALSLTVMAGVLGVVGGFFAANPILNALVASSASSGGAGGGGQGPRGGGGGGMMARFAGAGGGLQNTLRDIHAVVGYDILIYGALAVVVIAVVGSAIPAFLISKVRPAEVMRND